MEIRITKPFRKQFEAAAFIKSGYYIVPSPSTALLFIEPKTYLGKLFTEI